MQCGNLRPGCADDAAGTSDGRVAVGVHDAEDLFRRIFTPIIRGVQALSAAGFSRTYVAMLAPVSIEDEDEFCVLHGFECPLALRLKLTRVGNRVLAEMCAEAGIPFLDVGDQVARNGVLAEEW